MSRTENLRRLIEAARKFAHYAGHDLSGLIDAAEAEIDALDVPQSVTSGMTSAQDFPYVPGYDPRYPTVRSSRPSRDGTR